MKRYGGTIAADKRKTRMRLNRRQPERFDLSGQQDERVLKIVAAIDTSGSVSDRDVAYILNEITAILARRRHVLTVIECDSEVQRVYQVKTPADTRRTCGRGGTAFTPVIEYVNKDRFFRDALLIYFTDGYGEWAIPRPKTYRNLWVVLGDPRNLSVKEPHGAVVALGRSKPMKNEIVVNKTTDSVTTGTNYLQLLQYMGIETVVVTGLVTDQCVASTVRGLADAGYKVICVEDACAAGSMELHDAELPAEVWLVASSSEEVGLRGGQTATRAVSPDVAIVLDTACWAKNLIMAQLTIARLVTGRCWC